MLVPLALIAIELPRIRTSAARHAVRLLAIPIAVYVGWITFVRIRVGAWPFTARSGRLTPVPFGGVVHTIRYSPYRGSAVPWIALAVLLVVGAVMRGRHDAWFATAIAFAVMGVFLGWNVWQRPDDFGRVLLPLYAYSVILIASALWEQRTFVTLQRARTPAESGVA